AYVFDLFVRVEAADAEPDRRVGELFADAHRAKDVARLEARAGAGRAARHGDVLDGHHQPLALDERERNVEGARWPMLERAVELDLFERRREELAEPLALPEDPRVFGRPLFEHEVGGLAEPRDARHVERARPRTALVPTAVHLSDEAHARLRAPD